MSTKNKRTLQEKTHPIKSRGKLRTLTIEVDDPTEVLFATRQTLRLGLGPDGIPLRVRESLGQFLLAGKGFGGVVTEPGGSKWGI